MSKHSQTIVRHQKTGILIVSFLLQIPINLPAQLEFNSYISTSTEHNDNIDLEPDNQESDWITAIEPGISLKYDSVNLDADLDYSMRFRFFNDNTDKNEKAFKDVQRANGHWTLFPDNPFNFNANGGISRVIIDDRASVSEENEYTNKATRYKYTLNPSYTVRLGSMTNLNLDYFFTQSIYEEIEDTSTNPFDTNDFVEHRGSVELLKYLVEQNTVFMSYEYRYFDEDKRLTEDENEEENSDYKRHSIMTGIDYAFGSDLSLSALAGWSEINYTKDYQDNQANAIWKIGLDYALSETVQTRLEYSNDFTPSVNRGVSLNEEARFILTYSHRFIISTEIFATQTEYEEENSKDEGAGARISCVWPLGRSFSVHVRGDYAEYTYLEQGLPDENVDRYGFGTGVNVTFNHLTIGLNYTYRRNESTVDPNDYTNNIVLFEFRWDF